MKKLSSLLLAGALIFSLSGTATAHDPPDFLGAVWAWPESALPVLDGDLGEWDILPPEFFITEADVVQSDERPWNYVGDLDPSSLSFRWALAYNDETDRIYYVFEKYDDIHRGSESIEGVIDADHSGGTFWSIEGMTDEEAQRQKGRHAQTHHWQFDEGFSENWSWFWMTQGDWYRDPEWSQQAHRVEGTPGNNQEARTYAEWWQIYWDDYNWTSAEESIIHDFQADQIIGVSVQVHDGDAEFTDDCNCWGRWTIGPNVESFGDADFLADFLLLPIDETVDFDDTAVEEDSWGRIKASVSK